MAKGYGVKYSEGVLGICVISLISASLQLLSVPVLRSLTDDRRHEPCDGPEHKWAFHQPSLGRRPQV